MAPKEAAILIAKLEPEIALSLLERMPGKRMGQILSLMDPARAIELTKGLSDKKQL
jgi:flagellar motility protein MotE (MotC chaperone)